MSDFPVDVKQANNALLIREMQTLQSYLRLPADKQAAVDMSQVRARLQLVKKELSDRKAFIQQPGKGAPTVPSSEAHGVHALAQKAPPPLEDLQEELALLQAQENPANDERIAILKKAIAARI